MSDPQTTAKSARESLARGLNALQADPNVPPQLVELAAPIAQAMGALHQLERTGQVAPHAEIALTHLRGALGKLQTEPTRHPAVGAALEAVASSLSLVHALGQQAQNQTAALPPQAGGFPPPVVVQPAGGVAGGPPALSSALAPTMAAPHGAAGSKTASMPQKAMPTGANPAAPAGPPQVARDPFAAPDPFAARGAGQAHAPAGHGGAPPAAPHAPVPAPPAGNLQVVPAELGAHSATNFYKGLSGNDIIDHGGLFVSTYVSPKLGAPIRLRVSLPGGYEFEANAVVKWVREQGGGDAPPGFGAQFTQITPEARQLVYRYVRNREPLFHDDL